MPSYCFYIAENVGVPKFLVVIVLLKGFVLVNAYIRLLGRIMPLNVEGARPNEE